MHESDNRSAAGSATREPSDEASRTQLALASEQGDAYGHALERMLGQVADAGAEEKLGKVARPRLRSVEQAASAHQPSKMASQAAASSG